VLRRLDSNRNNNSRLAASLVKLLKALLPSANKLLVIPSALAKSLLLKQLLDLAVSVPRMPTNPRHLSTLVVLPLLPQVRLQRLDLEDLVRIQVQLALVPLA